MQQLKYYLEQFWGQQNVALGAQKSTIGARYEKNTQAVYQPRLTLRKANKICANNLRSAKLRTVLVEHHYFDKSNALNHSTMPTMRKSTVAFAVPVKSFEKILRSIGHFVIVWCNMNKFHGFVSPW